MRTCHDTTTMAVRTPPRFSRERRPGSSPFHNNAIITTTTTCRLLLFFIALAFIRCLSQIHISLLLLLSDRDDTGSVEPLNFLFVPFHAADGTFNRRTSTTTTTTTSLVINTTTNSASASERGNDFSLLIPPPSMKQEQQQQQQQQQQQPSPRIPHRLYFIHTQRNILKNKEPTNFYNNLINTIQQYREAWRPHGIVRVDFMDDFSEIVGTIHNGRSRKNSNNRNATMLVHFLTDDACQPMVRAAEPRLLPFYQTERNGAFQADICRVAALYLTGGYYFDVDMRTIQAWIQEDSRNDHSQCSFSTTHHWYKEYFSQSFIAAAPRHVVLKQALATMLEHYQHLQEPAAAHTNVTAEQHFFAKNNHDLMGPRTLHAAYDTLKYDAVESTDVCFLQELDLRAAAVALLKGHVPYPHLQRQNGRGGDCNHAMHNEAEERVYFFSRFVGSSKLCEDPETPLTVDVPGMHVKINRKKPKDE